MAKYFAAPASNTGPRTLAVRSPGDRLWSRLDPVTAGENVYVVDGAVTTVDPSGGQVASRTFYGGHAVEPVTSSEASLLTGAGFTVVDTDALTAAAVLYLTAASVSPSWSGAAWANSGTAGSALDAAFQSNGQVTFTGSGFRIPVQSGSTSGTAGDDGFAVVDDGTLSGSMGGDWTCTLDFTPLYDNPETCRYLRKYTAGDIVTSGSGLVVESTRPVGGFIAAVVTGVSNMVVTGGASFIGSTAGGRHAVTLRMADGVFSVFRGRHGAILERPVVGSPASSGDLRIGPGQVVHGLAWWTSALSDNEIAALHAATGSVN